MDKLCKLSDEQLVKNYANGDSDAFDTLLARYQQKIYSYILFLVHDDEVADDLYNQTRQIRGKRSFLGLAYPHSPQPCD